MKYFVTLEGKEHAVDISRAGDGSLRVQNADGASDVDVVSLDRNAFVIRVGTRVLDLVLEDSGGTTRVHAGPQRGVVLVQSERERSESRKSGASAGREKDVRSPMPGRVVKVLVQVGDVVGPGQAVVVVEAMKMENEVRAVRGGTVSKIHVSAGGAVEGNGVLVSFQQSPG